ncbi:hypothetical protein D9757_001190 [Collybiopsis confluens]|uniref:Serine/threonine-protein phosphatase 4 regulatory subunit 3-like central domain-containing protein n=1 Tax=Collybiopsis confluens TaxID=2823264 RepID=A0A8H5I177_9AGAR|nr:hypothetical protein D9757_001190 [Collybiopsis confluens]
MNGDGDGQNSLIVIPPANEADVAAGLASRLDTADDTLSLNSSTQIHPQNNTEYPALNEENSGLALADPIQAGVVKHEDEPLDLLVNHVEMLDAAGEHDGTSDEISGTVGDDEQEYYQNGDPNEMKRVKVYQLVGACWVDKGTAFCFGHLSEDGTEALLTARSEKNVDDIILSTTIRTSDVYQRQQETLIVWTEPDGVDYALSFQDSEGCAEVWSFIVDVQRHLSGATDDQHGAIVLDSSSPLPASAASSSLATASIMRTGHLPLPRLGNIDEIDKAIKALARTNTVKEKICQYIQSENYIKHLIGILHDAEEIESLENLHALCGIMQTILMLNDHNIYEQILEDDYFLHVCGMLEYDPEFPTFKANFRQFLMEGPQYHEPVLIRDYGIHRKIHHTYRLQFLKDVVLARVLDDSTFNLINSCILFNQIDIIQHVQQDNTFLRDIVKLYVDEEMLTGGAKKTQPPPQVNGTNSSESSPSAPNSVQSNGHSSDSEPSAAPLPIKPQPYAFAPPEEMSEQALGLRRSVIFLIQQLCVMGKNVQLPARLALFRTLVDRGVLFAVQWALGLSEKDVISKVMINAGGEVLSTLLDHDLNGVRGHVLKQVVAIEKERAAGKRGADKAETIVELCCRNMAQSKDLAVQSQVGDALKVWLDVPLTNESFPSGGSEATQRFTHSLLSQAMASKMARKDDPGTERFMDYFYKDCIRILLKPMYDLPDWKDVTETVYPLSRDQTNRYVYLCDLLYNFSLQHQFRSHFYLLSSNIVLKLATLLKAKDKHLRHAAFRVFRLLLKQNNQNTLTQLMKHDIFKPVLDLTIQESRRDNLLSCSCQEFFEHMRRENMKDPIDFCMTKHEAEIKALAETPLGSQRFQLFISRWDMNNEPPPPPEESKPDKSLDTRGWPPGSRTLEAEEESYFNGDEDEDDFIPSIAHSWSRGNGTSSPIPTSNGLKRKRRMAVAGALPTRGPRNHPPTPPRSPLLSSLVDYHDDEEAVSIDIPEDMAASSSSLPPSSPKPSHRQIRSPPNLLPALSEDDEDNLLEAMVSRSRPQSPGPGLMARMNALGPGRPEKRRRGNDDDDDDDDEELLERLSRSSKKPDLGKQKQKDSFGPGGGGGGPISITFNSKSKSGNDLPPKKFKLKIGTPIPNQTSSKPNSPSPLSATPSEPGAKDGDTG